jgi:hypothetical protein
MGAIKKKLEQFTCQKIRIEWLPRSDAGPKEPPTETQHASRLRAQHCTQRFFEPLLVMLYRAWSWSAPYDPMYSDLAESCRRTSTPLTMTMEQHQTFFIHTHPCYPWWEDGVLASALDLVHSLRSTFRDTLTLYLPNASTDSRMSPWTWAVRLCFPDVPLCSYMSHPSLYIQSLPVEKNTPHESPIHLVRDIATFTYDNADLAVVPCLTKRACLRDCFKACRVGGKLIIPFTMRIQHVVDILYVLGTCFDTVAVYPLYYVAPTATDKDPVTHRYHWVGIGKKSFSPHLIDVHEWLESCVSAPGCAPLNGDAFSAWRAYVERITSNHEKRTSPVHDDDLMEIDTEDECVPYVWNHARVSARIWTHTSTQVVYDSCERYAAQELITDTDLVQFPHDMYAHWFPSVTPLTRHIDEQPAVDPPMWKLGSGHTATLRHPCLFFSIEEPRHIYTLTQTTYCTATCNRTVIDASLPLGSSFVIVATDTTYWIIDCIRLSSTDTVVPHMKSWYERYTHMHTRLEHFGSGNACIRFAPRTHNPSSWFAYIIEKSS